MGLRKDIWRPALVDIPLAQLIERGTLEGLRVQWLPPIGPFQFLADPFGLWRDGLLHVFVEAYDYRDRIGAIEVLVYDRKWRLLARCPALSEPWHLSYPFVFEADGETWMLPESHRSGELMLYRATDFPTHWVRETIIALDQAAIDATPFFHNGLWWLFYTSTGCEADKTSALHIAVAERITGPWRPHPRNPVRMDATSARPGGTPLVVGGRPMQPVQDCGRTYGGAIRPLWFDRLDPDEVRMSAGPPLTPPAAFAPYVEGLHTLSAAGPVTLLDAKRTELSLHGVSIEVRREAGKLMRRLRAGST